MHRITTALTHLVIHSAPGVCPPVELLDLTSAPYLQIVTLDYRVRVLLCPANLRVLWAENCGLESIVIFNKLQRLFVPYNNLTELVLPANVMVANLHHNNLRSLQLASPPKIECLDCSYNPMLEYITIFHCKRLAVFKYAGTNLKNVVWRTTSSVPDKNVSHSPTAAVDK